MCSRKYWSKSEVSKLKEFIKNKAASLIPYFYENIMKGTIKVRKYSGFYEEMAKFLNRTPKQCKSKFQKFEEQIYTKYLSLPQRDYELLKWIRKNKGIHSKLTKILNTRRSRLKATQDISNAEDTTECIYNLALLDENRNNQEDDQSDSDKLNEIGLSDKNRSGGTKEDSDIDKKMSNYWCELITKIKQPFGGKSIYDQDLNADGKSLNLLLFSNILQNLSIENGFLSIT